MNLSIKPYHSILTKVQFLIKQLNLKLIKNTGRPLSISPEHLISIGLFWKKQTIKTIKSLWQIFSLTCSYKTLTVLLKKFAPTIALILSVIMKANRQVAHLVKHTDATDIPVCLNKNAKRHRTMNGLADWGHSGKGHYYGLKMNLTTDLAGRFLALHFAAGNGNDRQAFAKMNRDIDGIFIADAGYVSKDLAQKFFIAQRRILLAKPRANMKKLATTLFHKLYDTRMLIEQHFRNLKEFFGLVSSLPRSIDGYLANYLYSLLAYVLG
jgi:hypothetical protein